MKIVTTLALLLVAGVLSAQTLPDAPEATLRFNRSEWAFLAADATARGLDVYSTYRDSLSGGHDVFLPEWIAARPPVMAIYSGGAVAVQYFMARKLRAHGHRRLAYVLTIADVMQTMIAVTHNFSIAF